MVLHEADSAHSTQSTLLCDRLVRFLMAAYNGKHCILDLSLIDLLFIFSIWICHFDSVVSLDVEPDNQTLDKL